MLKGKLPSEVISERHQYVNGLKQFVEDQKKRLKQVLQQLGLTEDSLAKVEPKQACPYNPHHSVPEKSFKKHIEQCRLLKAGCQRDELPSQLANTDLCYEGKTSMKVEMDESLMNRIIWDDCVQSGEVYTGHRTLPASHIEENANLTQNDRLAIYRYVVNKSHEEGKVIEVDKTDELLTTDWGSLVKKGLLDAQNNEKYSSKLEQLAALRDMKRRRQSYRAKNVHITKKSYTEIIREVIVNQMEVLVPADSKRSVMEDADGDAEKYQSRSTSDSRQRKERRRENDDRGGFSHSSRSSRHRSRSRDRDRKKPRFHEDNYHYRGDGEENKSSSSRSSRISDLRSNDYESRDIVSVELMKREPESSEKAASGDANESWNKDMPSQSGDRNEASSRSSSVTRKSKRSRSRSYSSSASGDEDRKHGPSKKSKHKKKSKHSKKHSKKHKR